MHLMYKDILGRTKNINKTKSKIKKDTDSRINQCQVDITFVTISFISKL
jgi:hypothetical protein